MATIVAVRMASVFAMIWHLYLYLYLYLLLKEGDILGFVPLSLVLLQLISRTLFGFVTYHPFWLNEESPLGGASRPRSGELAKYKIADGRIQSRNI